jgi:hypothetical protein
MKTAAFVALLALAGALAGAPVQAAPAQGGQSTLAQSASGCGTPPMKPTSCLSGSWVCHCQGSGQICDWELIGCDTAPGIPRRSDQPRQRYTSPPLWPDAPDR